MTPERRPGTLRIVAWNCAGAFHRKLRHLVALRPDLAVVPEACMPDRLDLPAAATAEWMGRLAHKGLLVLGFGEWKVRSLPKVERKLEWILPVAVDGPLPMTLVGVWAMNGRSTRRFPTRGPMVQPTSALRIYKAYLSAAPAVVLGDFNNAPQWDTPRRPDFANLVAAYHKAGLRSVYHELTAVPFGAEPHPTHWWRDRRIDGPTYHIDYVFVPEAWLPATTVDVGGFDAWVTRAGSDHAAITIDVDLGALPSE